MIPEQILHARALLTQSDASIASIARLLGVSRSSIYKHIPDANGSHLPRPYPGRSGTALDENAVS